MLSGPSQDSCAPNAPTPLMPIDVLLTGIISSYLWPVFSTEEYVGRLGLPSINRCSTGFGCSALDRGTLLLFRYPINLSLKISVIHLRTVKLVVVDILVKESHEIPATTHQPGK